MTAWHRDDAPDPVRIGPLGWFLLVLRIPALGVVCYGGLMILLVLRAVEAPLFAPKRPFTPWITRLVCRAALAILGLRSLYFVLARAIGFFRHLKIGLSIVLVFIGVKMLLGIWDIQIRSGVSLSIVLAIILTSMIASIIAARREGRHLPTDDGPDEPSGPPSPAGQ